MTAGASIPTVEDVTPHSDIAVFLIQRNYVAIGADDWNTRRVHLLAAKLGDTRKMMAARLRIAFSDYERREKHDSWTQQDGLILALLEREIDLIRGIGRSGNIIGSTV